jgi:indole-3-glycerol phosphate synthase
VVGLLAEILEQKRSEVRELNGRPLPRAPERRALGLTRASGEPLALIAEIERRSPSAGALSTKLSVAERARMYQEAGADMVSVLCDSRYFGGSYAHLSEARAACSLPVLCKEFVIDEAQIAAAHAFGADAVLIIVRCVEPARVKTLVQAARAHGIEPFVEVTTEEESRVALDAGSTLIGVNARDLDTLVMDAARAERVLAALPKAITRVHLSGVATPADVERMAASGVDAVLIGEALMRQDDPSVLLTELRRAAGAR